MVKSSDRSVIRMYVDKCAATVGQCMRVWMSRFGTVRDSGKLCLLSTREASSPVGLARTGNCILPNEIKPSKRALTSRHVEPYATYDESYPSRKRCRPDTSKGWCIVAISPVQSP